MNSSEFRGVNLNQLPKGCGKVVAFARPLSVGRVGDGGFYGGITHRFARSVQEGAAERRIQIARRSDIHEETISEPASGLVVSRIDGSGYFAWSFCLTAQGLDGDLVNLLDEFLCYRFKLFQDGPGFIKLCAGRQILQATREIARGRRKLREHAAAFVSRFA
jgi:hypothetical protein